MFFILSKVFSWLILPVSMIAISLTGALYFKKPKLKNVCKWTGIIMFLFFTNPFIAKLAMNVWEPEAVPYEKITERYEWVVVLGGITEPNRPPYDRAHFNKGADRMIHAIELYKKKAVRKILISGGSGVLAFDGKPESIQLKNFAISMGVRSSDVVIDDQSKNTWENAHNTRSILVEKKAQGKILLITSAFHMPRAKACFEKLGFNLDTFPTDYYGGPYRFSLDELIIPGIYGIQVWSILLKEWGGLIAYKITGYV